MMEKSYSHGVSQIPLKGETIGENLRGIVERFGEHDALIVKHQNYRATYNEFWVQVGEVAKALIAAGIQKGDRVGIWSSNRFEWVLIQFGTARIGAIMVNINPAYKVTGLRYAVNQSEISLLIAANHFRKTNNLEILAQLGTDCKFPQHTLILEEEWQNFIEAGKKISDEELDSIESELQFDDPVNIQYTSGTTGYPKGATLTHHNVLNNGFFIGEHQYFTENDRVCIPVPFYHCFGMVLGNMACVTHGSCMVIPDEAFDPDKVMRTVQEEKCTALYGVPTMFIAELEHPNFNNYDFSSLRTGIMSGSPCPAEIMRQVMSKMNMTEITIPYGMTETSPVSTMSWAHDDFDVKVNTVGSVMPHVEIKIVDPETNKIVPRGQQGELCTRGYSVMRGYWNNDEETSRVIDKARWMHTGDLAVMTVEGNVKIVGRSKDVIIRGGENISPREIEEYIIGHENIIDVQVIGVPSVKYGEEVMAWVKVKEGVTLTAEELTAYCKGQIATYKIPKYWKFVDSFPMTVTGKIRKGEMREISSRELGLENINQFQKA
ncbi:MAG: AMP-binding protein [Bacteroidota bacterium]|nr:AMP-binding protein [Bacteroidota bacterium]